MATTVNRTDTFEQWRTKTNQISTDLGTVASLNTTAKDSAVSAINELKSRTIYIGTTGIVTDRSSAAQSLTGISSIQLPGSTSGTVTIQPAAIAGTTTLTAPATSGTIVTTGDTGTVTNTMLAGSIANSKLVNSTISGVALGSNLNALTLGDGLDGVSYNGTTGITATVGSSIARRADVHFIGTTSVALNRVSGNLGLAGITSVAMPGSTSGTITLQPAAIAGTTTLTLPSGTGTILSDQSAINGSQLVAGSVANAKLTSSSLTVGTTTIALGASSTTLAGLTSVTSTSFVGALTGNSSSATVLQTARAINGVSFDGSAAITITANTPNALSVGSGILFASGSSFDGSAARTITVDSSVVALKADTHYIGTTAVALNRSSANLGLTGISSITLPGGTSGTVQIVPVAAVGTGTILTIPATTGTIVTTGDSATVSTTMLTTTGVTAGTYNNVTVDAKGRATAGSNVAYLTSYTETSTLQNVASRGATTTTSLTAASFVKSGGTASQFLKADGSSDSNVYLTGNQSITLSGDISGTGATAISTTIGAGTVTLAKMANLAANSIIGNNTGSAATPIALTVANVQTMLGLGSMAYAATTSYQPIDGDLTAIAAISDSGTGFLKKTAANTWALDTNTYLTSSSGVASIAGGTGVSVNQSTGAVTVSIGQSVATTAAVTFGSETLNGALAQNVNVASASPSNVYTLTNNNANYSTAPTRFAIDSAGNVSITGNLSVSGTTTITATNYVPDWPAITNKQYYGQIKDGTTTAVAATNISNGDAIWYRGSNGVTVTVGSNDATYGDNVLISLSAVPNSSLANSSVTIGTTAIALGASSTTLAGLTSVSSTAFTGALTGNASTATTLQTARAINGVSFNGSADITITANTTNALTIGTGLSGTSFNGSSNITIANTGVLDLTAGGAISITGTKANYTVAHTDTSSVADLAAATNTFISGQTYDTYGHVLTRTTGTVDFTVAANYGFANIAVTTDTGYTWGTINAATTQAAESNTDTITLVPGSTAGVAGIDIQGSTVGATDALRIAHSDTSNLSGTYGTNGISSITVDGMGHITAVSTATYLTSSTGVSSIAGTSNQVIASGSTGAVALSLPQDIATTSAVTFGSVTTSGNIVVGGNLTVNGTTTTVNSTTLDVVDLNITVGKNATTAAAADGAGLTVGNYASNPTLLYVNASNRWVMNRGVEGSSFVRTGGTSSQFLKADGSVDSATYLTGNQLIGISGDATGSGNTSIVLTLANSGVTAGTYNNVTVDAKGRVTVGSNVSYLTGNQSISLTGDLSGSGATSISATIASGAVTLGKMANLAANSIIGNNSGVSAAPTALTVAQVQSLLGLGSAAYTSASSYLTGNQTITVSGDASGSGATSISLTLANSGVTAGTYNNVTVDAKGRVTSGSNVAYLTSYTDTNTTYTVSASTAAGGAFIDLTAGGTGGTSTYVKLASSNYLGISRTAADTITFTNNGITQVNGSLTGGGSSAATGIITLAGTSNQVTLGFASGTYTFGLPQSIATTSAPQFASIGVGTAASGVTGNITASAFVKSGGTSSQFLKADGSTDGTSYLSGTVAIGNGGTGSTTVSGARTNLSIPALIATGAAISASATTGGANLNVQSSFNNLGSSGSNTYTVKLTSGTGITVADAGSGTEITISNSGVTSITAGTGITVTGTTTPSISIPQAIGTTSNVQHGSLGIGTAASGTAGEIRATDNVTAYYSSDERLKTNIVKIDNALEKVSQIDGIIYDWNDDYKKDHGGVDGYFLRDQNSGVIAQQVEKVFPNVVAERADGYKAVRYELLVPLLIEAIKDLKAEIEALKANK